MPAPKRMVFHVDIALQGDRSMYIEEAVWHLSQDTHGKLLVELRYDLDYSQRFPLNEWYLVDLPAESELTAHFDKKHGTSVLGECDSEYHIAYLVTDRLFNHDRFVHVVMHEILHAAGLPHVIGDPHAIMAAIVVPKLPLHMSPTDLDAFCKTIDCTTKEVLTP